MTAEYREYGVLCGDPADTARADRIADRPLLGFYPKDPNLSGGVAVDFNGLATFLGWDDARKHEILREVILLTILAFDRTSNVRWATRRIARAFLPDDDPVRIQAEIYLLRGGLRDSEELHFMRSYLPVPIEEDAAELEQELDPIVDRFLELGWSMQQIYAEFEAAILHHTDAKWISSEAIRILAGAKCFPQGSWDRTKLLTTNVLPRVWDQVVRELRAYYDPNMAKYKTEEIRDFLALVRLCSAGQLATGLIYERAIWLAGAGYFTSACQLIALTLYGHNRVSREQHLMRNIRQQIAECAFIQAIDEGRYGVAAAIVQQFLLSGGGLFTADQFTPLLRQRTEKRFADQLAEAQAIKKATARRRREEQIQREIASALEAEATKYAAHAKSVTAIAMELGQPIRFHDALGMYMVDAMAAERR